MIRRLNAPVVDIARFAELTGKRRPLGMLAAGTTYQLLRETYFDSADGALSGRGMTLKLLLYAEGKVLGVEKRWETDLFSKSWATRSGSHAF